MKDLSLVFYVWSVIWNWLCGSRRSNDTDGKADLENPGDSMSKHAEQDHAEALKVSERALHQGMTITPLKEAWLFNFPQFPGYRGIEKSS